MLKSPKCNKIFQTSEEIYLFIYLFIKATGLRPVYVIIFKFLLISFQMQNNDDMIVALTKTRLAKV